MRQSVLQTIGIAILLLLTLQMAGTLVESIYILDLLKTSLDEKALGILFFFSPVFLFFVRNPAPRRLLWVLTVLLILARSLTPYLNTGGRMLASGIGTSAALLLLPILLAIIPQKGSLGTGVILGRGLALAVGISVCLRTLNYTIDLSLTPASGWTGWLLGAAFFASLSASGAFSPALGEGTDKLGSIRGGVTSASIGLFTVLTLVYFAFSSPGVISRWTEGNYTAIVTVVSLFSLGWLFLSAVWPGWISRIGPGILLAWNLLFSLTLVWTILAHSVAFPASPEATPVVVGLPVWHQQIPLFLMLILFPVIFVDFAIFARAIAQTTPTPHQLAPGFLLGALLLVVLIFMNIFSNVWGYVEPVSTFFRGKFWLPFALAGVLITLLSAIHSRKARSQESEIINKSGVVWWGASLGILFLVTLIAAISTGTPNSSPAPKGSLLVMTYNIQQANDDSGEKSYTRQLLLIRQVDPDILGLQESDSARISLGNNDYVRYYAGKLGYHVYYGPKTVTGTYGTALLSKFPLENPHTVFSFSDRDEIGTTEAEVVLDGQRFTIYNVHPAGSDQAMLAFAQTLLARAFRQENVIALGDYNLRESDESYQLIADQYHDSWLAVYPTGIDEDGLDMSGDKRIDHVFLSPHLDALDAFYLLPPDSATDHPAHWVEIGL